MSLILDGTSGTTGNLANGDLQVNGVTVGKGGGTVSTNTAVGASALSGGSQTGTSVTAIGYEAGLSNTSGVELTAVGRGALRANTSGNSSTAVGRLSLAANTTGGDNSALGSASLNANTTGSYNTALGSQSLQANTTASNNTAVGYQAGYSNTTGQYNVLIGFKAGYSASTVASNICVGSSSGYNLTAGGNTFVGDASGYTASSGTNNTFIGNGAGYGMSTGSKNTILGSYSGNQGGLDIRTSSNCIVLSDGDGNPRQVIDNSGNLTIGTGGTLYGDKVVFQQTVASAFTQRINGINNGGTYRYIAFNAGAGGTQTGYIQSGDGSTTTYATSSDYRLKENIAPINNALEKISNLKPCDWIWKETGKTGQGFVAHELQEIVPDAVCGKKDEIDEEGNPVYQGVDTSFLVATLTAALQELKAIVDAQALEIAELKGAK